MQREKAARLESGLRAVARGVRLNKSTKSIEVSEELPFGESKVVRTYPVQTNDTAGFRNHNIITLINLHRDTEGGRGRTVDPVILRAWAALHLPDRSIRVSLDGYIESNQTQSDQFEDPSFRFYFEQ